ELLQEKKRNYAQYIVCDTQISVGYMHSGNPIMTWMDQEEIVLGLDGKLFTEGSWGHFHEIGHNMQRGEWTFEGTTEVTTNIFTLYNMEKMIKIAPIDNQILKEHRIKYKSYLKKGGDFEEWKKDPFIALMTYLKLQEKFGWNAYKSVFAQYSSLPDAQKPKNNQDKIDTWVRIFSKTVKMNLFPYFRKWAWPVSDKVNSELKTLPEWKFEDY
ncbi:MAG TPA: M60 family metallopeptidase, partial [Leptospiraceae bacterium]|nr:M60 family metallopeptidase [Leptospiraceae bacterium]